jgi:uncharacterized protein (DUF1778 family)
MSKSESRKLPIVRSVRLSAEEAAAIDAAAEARGLGSSSFAREAMLRAAKLPVPARAQRRDVVAAEFVPVLGELGRVGNNLNQAIRLANAARRPADVAAIEATRSALLDLHRFVMAQAAA